MNYTQDLINKLTRMDDYYLNKWTSDIAKIFMREFNGREDVHIYLLPYKAGIYKPRSIDFVYYGVMTAKTDVGVIRYNIAEHLMYRLQYKLAKDYGIVFSAQPRNIWVKTKHWNTQIRVTRLTITKK